MTERLSPTEPNSKPVMPAVDSSDSKLSLNFNSSSETNSADNLPKKSGEFSNVSEKAQETDKIARLVIKKSSSGEFKTANTTNNASTTHTEVKLSTENSQRKAPPLPISDDDEERAASDKAKQENRHTDSKGRTSREVNAINHQHKDIPTETKTDAGADLKISSPSSSAHHSSSDGGRKSSEHTSLKGTAHPPHGNDSHNQKAATELHNQRHLAPPLYSPKEDKDFEHNNKGAEASPNEVKPYNSKSHEDSSNEDKPVRLSTSGTKNDLIISLVYLAFLIIGLLWGANSLLVWKHDLDVQPSISYRQLCWSYNNESLAFMRSENKHISKGQSLKNSLWVSDRFGDGARCLQDNLPENYELTGWFANDSLLVLNSSNLPIDIEKLKESSEKKNIQLSEIKLPANGSDTAKNNASGLSFAEINCQDNSIKFLSLGVGNVQVVGCNSKEIFLAQYLASNNGMSHINLLSYQPGSQEAKLLVSIPSRKDEMMHVDSVTSSPDGNKLAIVISMIASLSQQVDQNNDTPLGVWIFSRDTKTLAWTAISANNAKDLSVVWSKDSKWLGGVARYTDEAEIFAFYGDNNCQAARLRGVPQEGPITPLIDSNEHALTFISLNRIDRYNFDTQQDVPLLSADNLEYMPSNFAVSTNGTVAYAAKPYNAHNIYICTLNNPNSTVVKIPTDSAKHTWLYRAVGRLQYSVDYWLNF
ncbi:MAG: hypothetical protein ACI376_08655 [Candidatus Bruticola sp.]